MKYYQVEHPNCFREWVVAKNEKEAIDFLEKNRFHGEDFSYEKVNVIEQETDFHIEVVSQTIYKGNSADTWGHWFEPLIVDGKKIEIECSSGILDEKFVVLIWEYSKGSEQKELLAVSTNFDEAKRLIVRRVQQWSRKGVDTTPFLYDYVLVTHVLNEL